MQFKIGCSPLTNRIFAGRVTEKNMWVTNSKKDVTDTAPLAVAQYLIQSEEAIEFNYRNERYVLKVEKSK